jgi:hypothetical protein
VVVERVAREQHDIRLDATRIGQNGSKATGTVAAVFGGDTPVINMQIGAMDEGDLATLSS